VAPSHASRTNDSHYNPLIRTQDRASA
jgi:hypothetical protein